MPIAFRRQRHPKCRNAAERVIEDRRVTAAEANALGQLPQEHSSHGRLHLRQTPIGAEGLVQPAESRGMLALVYSFVTLAVILETPSKLPNPVTIGSYEAPFAASREYLV